MLWNLYNKGVMIIYLVKNKVNDKQYIGQTTTPLNRRWSAHISNAKNKRYSSVLANAIRKYGSDTFKLEILEKCSSLDELNKAEIKWIRLKDTLAPNGYNIETGGKNNIWTDEMKRKMRKIQSNRSPEWQENMKKGMQKRGEEWRKKLSESRKYVTLTKKQLKSLESGRKQRYKDGREGLKGESNPRSKVNANMVREIRKLYMTGCYSQQKISDKFGINQSMVSKIVLRQAWRHID